jgi:hypothetical protein
MADDVYRLHHAWCDWLYNRGWRVAAIRQMTDGLDDVSAEPWCFTLSALIGCFLMAMAIRRGALGVGDRLGLLLLIVGFVLTVASVTALGRHFS